MVEGNGTAGNFSLHHYPCDKPRQETNGTPKATNYHALRFYFPTLLAQMKKDMGKLTSQRKSPNVQDVCM